MDEQKMNDYINTFIMQWCGEYIAHLVDSDDNAGERLRKRVQEYAESKAREARLEAARRVREEWHKADNSSDPYPEFDAIENALDAIEKENSGESREGTEGE